MCVCVCVCVCVCMYVYVCMCVRVGVCTSKFSMLTADFKSGNSCKTITVLAIMQFCILEINTVLLDMY